MLWSQTTRQETHIIAHCVRSSSKVILPRDEPQRTRGREKKKKKKKLQAIIATICNKKGEREKKRGGKKEKRHLTPLEPHNPLPLLFPKKFSSPNTRVSSCKRGYGKDKKQEKENKKKIKTWIVRFGGFQHYSYMIFFLSSSLPKENVVHRKHPMRAKSWLTSFFRSSLR